MDYLRAQIIQAQIGAGSTKGRGQSAGTASAIDPETFAALAESYTGVNPNAPLHVAYVKYMVNFFTGDFGRSIVFSEPVANIIAKALPWTLFLMTGVSISMFLIGIMLGAIMGYYEGSKLDAGLTLYGLVQASIPFFVVAVALLGIFAIHFEIFPRGGRFDPDTNPGLNIPFMRSVLWHAALPMISMIVTGLAGSLAMRGNSIRVLGEDYIRVARLRGLPDHRIAFRYVLRNAVLPMYTGFMISLGGLVGGSVILERIFRYPGLGWYTVEAFKARDFPLIMGTFILSTAVVVAGVLVADLTYGLLDPRIESGEREAF